MTDAAEREMFRDTVRRFLRDEIEPQFTQWEQAGIVPREVYRSFGDMGLLCVDLPEEHGGIGAPFEYSMIIAEETAKLGLLGLTTNLTVHSDIVAPYILHLGSDEQKRKYLPGMASGDIIGAIAMTEPGAGSDLQGIRTTALADEGGGFRVNGSKTFISNGQHCDVVVTATKTDPAAGARGTTLFLIDADKPGFARGRNLGKIGQHCSDTSELSFSDVQLGSADVLGRVGGGFGHLMDELPRERLALAVGAVGHAQGALDLALDYVRERKAFGQSLAQFQNTRFELARARTDIELNRAFVERCIELYGRGALDVPTAAMVKYASTEMQCRVCDVCLQCFGGYGYMEEYPISRFFVDARVQRIYGGASEIMLEVIARDMLGR